MPQNDTVNSDDCEPYGIDEAKKLSIEEDSDPYFQLESYEVLEDAEAAESENGCSFSWINFLLHATTCK